MSIDFQNVPYLSFANSIVDCDRTLDFFSSIVSVRESIYAGVTFDFSTRQRIEESVLTFMIAAGFNLNLAGSKYIGEILTRMIFDCEQFVNPSNYFESVAKKYGVKTAAISLAVSRVLNVLSTGKIKEINELLQAHVVHMSMLTPAKFLSAVGSQMILMRRRYL